MHKTNIDQDLDFFLCLNGEDKIKLHQVNNLKSMMQAMKKFRKQK